MGDISQMSQEELSTMLNELQASRENWMAENLLSTEMSKWDGEFTLVDIFEERSKISLDLIGL